jgi:hypothetical protein
MARRAISPAVIIDYMQRQDEMLCRCCLQDHGQQFLCYIQQTSRKEVVERRS